MSGGSQFLSLGRRKARRGALTCDFITANFWDKLIAEEVTRT